MSGPQTLAGRARLGSGSARKDSWASGCWTGDGGALAAETG